MSISTLRVRKPLLIAGALSLATVVGIAAASPAAGGKGRTVSIFAPRALAPASGASLSPDRAWAGQGSNLRPWD